MTAPEHCLKCGEVFYPEPDVDSDGNYTAMTVCPSCFEYTVGPPPREETT